MLTHVIQVAMANATVVVQTAAGGAKIAVVHAQLHVDRNAVNLVHHVDLHVDLHVRHVQLHVVRRVMIPVQVDVERDVLLNQLQLTLQLTELKLIRIPQNCQVHLMVLDIHIPLRPQVL